MNDSLVLSCTGLEKSYRQGAAQIDVLQGLEFSLRQGDKLAIMGASGSGKSTLLHILGGLDAPSAGEVVVAGQSLAHLSEREKGDLRNYNLGFVYQFHHLLPEFSALENVAMPLLIRGTGARQASAAAQALLASVGLAQRAGHKPGEMSGGERQRAAIARALVTRPRCLLADEPTGNLDEQTAAQVFSVMLELNRQHNVSLVMVTHNQALASKLDRTMELREGRLHSG